MEVQELLKVITNADKQAENVLFKKYLRQFSNRQIDEQVKNITERIEPTVDCTRCGNCCKKLEPGLQPEEIEKLARINQTDVITFKKTYVDFDGEALFLKAKPCMFLNQTTCSIYADRPASCADYPHLKNQNFKYKRNVWFNYSICPIVYLVVEELKKQTGFTSHMNTEPDNMS